MKITRVEIKNWRSIKEIDFYPEDITVLVGPNNAGKSNVMGAINFLLGSRWPMPANLTDRDFYEGDRSRDIYIRLGLDHPQIGGVDFNTSKPNYVFQAYGHDGYAIRGFSNVQREELSFAYVDAARNYDRQFGLSRWSLFGNAIRLLHDNLKQNGGDLARLEAVLNEAHGLLRTDLYQAFEKHLKEAFASQLRTARYDVAFEFRTLDETNLYRGLYPTLLERGQAKSPGEVGSGVRNLLVLALFQASARTFKGGSVLGIEEPELYLHPHAQRSLMTQFEELAGEGNQIFVSTHSAAFIDIARSERIVLVEQCADDDEEVCTQARTTTAEKMLRLRQALHPQVTMNQDGRQAFLRGIRTTEMAEAFFARLIVIVEGSSEREALPLLLSAAGLSLDEEGVSIVVAGGKSGIDQLAHLYAAHGIPTYVIFDNDEGGAAKDMQPNLVLCRLLKLPEVVCPPAQVSARFAILQGCWEQQLEAELQSIHSGWYASLVEEARTNLHLAADRNKPLVARYVADRLNGLRTVPPFVFAITAALRAMLGELDAATAPPAPPPRSDPLDDPIPF